MAELSVGLIVTCMAPSAKAFRHFANKHFPSVLGQTTNTTDPYVKMTPLEPRKRRHFPGGLSELDSMMTFGTVIDNESSKDSASTKHLNTQESAQTNAFGV